MVTIVVSLVRVAPAAARVVTTARGVALEAGGLITLQRVLA